LFWLPLRAPPLLFFLTAFLANAASAQFRLCLEKFPGFFFFAALSPPILTIPLSIPEVSVQLLHLSGWLGLPPPLFKFFPFSQKKVHKCLFLLTLSADHQHNLKVRPDVSLHLGFSHKQLNQSLFFSGPIFFFCLGASSLDWWFAVRTFHPFLSPDGRVPLPLILISPLSGQGTKSVSPVVFVTWGFARDSRLVSRLLSLYNPFLLLIGNVPNFARDTRSEQRVFLFFSALAPFAQCLNRGL